MNENELLTTMSRGCEKLLKDFTASEVENIKLSYDMLKDEDLDVLGGSISCVYFLYDNNRNMLKIGQTRDLRRRVKQIKDCCKMCGVKEDLEIISLCYTHNRHVTQVEKFFHKFFEEYVYEGEWFLVDKKIIMSKLYDYNKNKKYVVTKEKILIFTECCIKDNKENPKVHFTNSLILNRFDSKNKYKEKRLYGDNVLFDMTTEYFYRYLIENEGTQINFNKTMQTFSNYEDFLFHALDFWIKFNIKFCA